MPNGNQEDQVDFIHPEYAKNAEYWLRCRTVVEGSDAVKREGELFLPPLAGQDSGKYGRYKRRALFYGASGRTVQGMLGALCGKEPVLEAPSAGEDFFESLLPVSMPIKSFIKKVAEEVITVGRCGLFIDPPSEGGEPQLSFYEAESIINWHTQIIEGKQQLVKLVLREEQTIAGEFAIETTIQYRVLSINAEGTYIQEIYIENPDRGRRNKKKFILTATIAPTKGGTTLTFIPFYFVNATGTTTEVGLPPILDLVNVNISHYMSSADLEHGRHFTALPVVWMAGFSDKKDTQPLYIGSETVWLASNKDARVEYLEFKGSGLGALENALKEKEGLMVTLGSNLLAVPKAASESADNQRLKRSGENNVLSNIADSVSEGITMAVRDLAEWRVINGFDTISVELNKEYLQAEPDPQLIAQLISMLQSGAMSWATFFFNMNKQGLIPDGVTAEEEQEAIEDTEFGKADVSVPEVPTVEPTETEDESSEETRLNPDDEASTANPPADA